MPKLIFTKPFPYTPSTERRVTTVYKPSDEPQAVNQECADNAIKAGVAKAFRKPKADAE